MVTADSVRHSLSQPDKITIKANSGLTEVEIQKMVKDAELNAESDKKLKELAEARNHADNSLHMARKSVTEYGSRLEAAQNETVNAAMAKLESAMNGNDRSDIDARRAELADIMQKLDQAMSANPSAQQAGEGAADPGAKAEHVVDAVFEEVKEPK